MCGPHPRDIATLRPRLRLPATAKPIEGWKIAVSMDLGFYEIDPDVRRNTEAALEVFRSLGATVEMVELGWKQEVLEAGLRYLEHLFGAAISTHLEEHGDKMTTYARAFAEKGRDSSSTDFLRTLEVAGEMYNVFGPIMAKHDLFICPTTALPAVKADFDQSRDAVEINGKAVNPMLGWVMTSPFNTLSRCPVLTLPSGRAGNGVPTGIQLIGKTYRDVDVIRAGLAYEGAAAPWYRDQSSRPNL